MPQQLFDWLNAQQPPTGFTDYDYPEAGDAAPPANPAMGTMPNRQPAPPPTRDIQPSPAGNHDAEGRMMLPDTGDGVARENAPLPSTVGKEGAVDSWDYSYDVVPVWAVPEELGGGEWVGQIEYAPSLAAYNPQIVRYVKVPRSGKVA